MTGPDVVTTTRSVRDLIRLWQDQQAAERFANQIVYQTYAIEDRDLLYGTTVLQPGRIGDQHFMTRGHFHLRPDRGETVLTLSGKGVLKLMSRSGDRQSEVLSTGSAHRIDGAWAHRVVNTGSEPLVFYVTWMADCGHDYDSITVDSF
ncbi:MAG: Glucose-6-phosphate isomerase [Fimbriimonadaceae bacterium]|nr:Glucose-6-phosphate isomerase [Fimbriimonadaceae bacterium]